MTSSLGIWIVRAGAEKLGRHLEHSLGGKLCGLKPTGIRATARHLRHATRVIANGFLS